MKCEICGSKITEKDMVFEHQVLVKVYVLKSKINNKSVIIDTIKDYTIDECKCRNDDTFTITDTIPLYVGCIHCLGKKQ